MSGMPQVLELAKLQLSHAKINPQHLHLVSAWSQGIEAQPARLNTTAQPRPLHGLMRSLDSRWARPISRGGFTRNTLSQRQLYPSTFLFNPYPTLPLLEALNLPFFCASICIKSAQYNVSCTGTIQGWDFHGSVGKCNHFISTSDEDLANV